MFEVGLCLSGNVGRDWCGGPWRQCQAFEVGLGLSGDVGEGLVRRTVAGRAECSRSDFVCPGISGRDWCGGPWRAGPSVGGRTLFVRGCRGGTVAEDRGGQGRMFEVGLCLSGDVGEGLVLRTVAGRAERSRSDFVCPGSTDVIGDAAVLAGFLCQRRANVAGNFVNFIKFRKYDERKNRKNLL